MKKWMALGATVILGVIMGAWTTLAQEAGRPPGMGRSEAMGRPGGPHLGMERFGRGGEHEMFHRAMALLDNDRVKAALGLTEEQTSGLRALAVETEKTTVKTRADIEVKGIELRELLRQDNPDHDAVIKKAGEISALRGDLTKQHIEALLRAKTILTPEQQKRIRTIVEERAVGGFGGMGSGFGMRRSERRGDPGAAPPPPANPPNGDN